MSKLIIFFEKRGIEKKNPLDILPKQISLMLED